MNEVATTNKQALVIKTPGDLQRHIIAVIQDPRYAANFEGVIDRQSVVIAMMHVRQNWEYISKCKPDSIINALSTAGAYGWTCDPITGHAYIVPFGDVATLIPGYRGLIDLVHRAGQARITAEVVYEGDMFADNGLWAYPLHKPSEDIDRKTKPITHVYAVARFNDGGIRFWVMTRNEIIAHRNNFCPSWKRNQKPSSLWHESNPSFAAMCRKTVIIKAIKSGEVPISLKDKRGREMPSPILDEPEAEPMEQVTFESPAGYHETLDAPATYTTDQQLPPTLDPAADAPDLQSDWEKRVRDCEPAAIDTVVRDAMENDGVDVRAVATERKQAIQFKAEQAKQPRRQTKLPGE
jgi:phage RecT family recombinase